MISTDKIEDAIFDLLTAFGVDEGDHTIDTPARVAKAWAEQLAGYDTDPAEHLDRTFTGPTDPGLVVVAGIRVVSTCAHHLLPIIGTATVAYRGKPGARVVGLSKLARVVEGYARRLQVQERIGWQVAHTIQRRLKPVGAACIITAAHGCMSLRGIQQPGALTTTHAWAGNLDDTDRAAVLAEHNRNAPTGGGLLG